jgi:hypothetical protein
VVCLPSSLPAFAGIALRLYKRFASTLPINMKPRTLKPALINAEREAAFRMPHRHQEIRVAPTTVMAGVITNLEICFLEI